MFTKRFTTELKFKCIQFQACNVPEQAETTTKKWFKDLHHFSRAYMVKIRKWDNVERLNFFLQIGRGFWFWMIINSHKRRFIVANRNWTKDLSSKITEDSAYQFHVGQSSQTWNEPSHKYVKRTHSSQTWPWKDWKKKHTNWSWCLPGWYLKTAWLITKMSMITHGQLFSYLNRKT